MWFVYCFHLNDSQTGLKVKNTLVLRKATDLVCKDLYTVYERETRIPVKYMLVLYFISNGFCYCSLGFQQTVRMTGQKNITSEN